MCKNKEKQTVSLCHGLFISSIKLNNFSVHPTFQQVVFQYPTMNQSSLLPLFLGHSLWSRVGSLQSPLLSHKSHQLSLPGNQRQASPSSVLFVSFLLLLGAWLVFICVPLSVCLASFVEDGVRIFFCLKKLIA